MSCVDYTFTHMSQQQYRQQLLAHGQSVMEMVERWVVSNINRPIKGFEHKKNHDGSFFSYKQQLSSTRLQVLAVAIYFLNRGKSTTEVLQLLKTFQ